MKTKEKLTIVIMGVAGSGKTTVGRKMAEKLKAGFLEGDDYHLSRSITKIKQGIALDDEDRIPWLKILNGVLEKEIRNGRKVVLACSALKNKYRKILAEGIQLFFVYLKTEKLIVIKRLKARKNHFFNLDLIDSQFEALEEPQDALIVNSNNSIDQVLEEIYKKIGKQWA